MYKIDISRKKQTLTVKQITRPVKIKSIKKRISILANAKRGLPGPQGSQGETGAQGPQGVPGVDGTDGQGVPTGGEPGQVLSKNSSDDFDTEWVDPSTGNISSIVGGHGISVDDTDPFNPIVNWETNNRGLYENFETYNAGDIVETTQDEHGNKGFYLAYESNLYNVAPWINLGYGWLKIDDKDVPFVNDNPPPSPDDGDLWWDTDDEGGVSGGGISSIIAGTNIVIDDTDPANPIISAPVSGDAHYMEDFTLLDTLTINHNLGKYPAVTVMDTTGAEVEGEVEHTNIYSLEVRFSAPFSGTITCN